MDRRFFLLLIALMSSVLVKADDSFILSQEKGEYKTLPFQIVTTKDSTILFPSEKIKKRISGISLDGSFTRTDKHYFVRILLKDVEGHEFLIMESYREINDDWSKTFTNYCEETKILNNIIPDSIKIFLRGASLQLTKIHYIESIASGSPLNSKSHVFNSEEVRLAQVESIVKRINEYNALHKKIWRAGVTKLSTKSFEEKMRILGLNHAEYTGGVEYYADGIFEIGDIEDAINNKSRETQSLSFVNSFDWRDQHGKYWVTSVKNQGDSGYCSAFAAVSATEAIGRLYYNQLIDFNLSEQEAACCNGTSDPWSGMLVSAPLIYIRDHGVCDEVAYPFVNEQAADTCRSSEITPNELISIGGFSYVPSSEENIKEALIKHGPLVSAISYWGWTNEPDTFKVNHAMAIVGFGQLQVGDTIYHWIEPDGFANGNYTVQEGDPHIGMTYLIYKNSEVYDVARGGYRYYIHYNYQNSVFSTYYIHPQITSMNYTDDNIICEDSDGDGYYFWGIGDKPSWCPEWIPNVRDGNDNNSAEGRMYYDSPNIIGSLEPLSPNSFSPLVINGNTTYNTRNSVYTHIRINSNAVFTVQDILNLFGRVTISIESGGELVIDGGVITNADIDLSVGGKLTIKNGGKLVMRTGTDFEAPIGASVEIESGTICKSNDLLTQ